MPHTSHADQLVTICREVFNQGHEFVQKITGNPNVDRPLQRIREFRNRPNPKVVVTVDMLSTGVDIPALEFIVFLRPVKSRILWEQMLGRGTRRCNDINKSKFVVFDCFDGTLIQYFKQVSSFALEPPRKTPLTIIEVIENIWQNIDRDYHIKVLVKRLLRIDKDMSAEARTAFAAWIPDGDVAAFAKSLPLKLTQDFAGTMRLLRNPDFQKLLLEYPRARRTFLTTIEPKDSVTSLKLERYGKFDSAEDYLDAFAKFVKANADKVSALTVLLQNPKDWRPAVMEELKRTLHQHGFEPEKLQRALYYLERLEQSVQINIVRFEDLAASISYYVELMAKDKNLFRDYAEFIGFSGAVAFMNRFPAWRDNEAGSRRKNSAAK